MTGVAFPWVPELRTGLFVEVVIVWRIKPVPGGGNVCPVAQRVAESVVWVVRDEKACFQRREP